MGLFSGIMVNAEGKGYELSMEDVRIQFNEAFEVLNAEAANFESFCGAVEKLELLNASIQQNDGKADKSLITFLNQNNGLADALGIDLSMEDFDAVVVGAEVSAACEGALANVWEAIKNFFKNIWDGIKNFFKNFFGMFQSAEKKATQATQNAAKLAQGIEAGNGPANSRFKLTSGGSPTGACCVTMQAFQTKIGAIEVLGNEFAKLTDINAAITAMLKVNGTSLLNAFNALGVKYKNGEPVQGASIWSQNDVVVGEKTVGTAFKKAGWNQQSIEKFAEDAKKLVAAGKNIEKGSAVLDQFSKMSDEQIIPIMQKAGFGEKQDHNLKVLKRIGRHIVHASKIIGQFTKDFIALLDDINSLSTAQKAEENANAAKAEAQKKQNEENAKKAAQVPTA